MFQRVNGDLKKSQTDGEPIRYTIIMEPTQQNWLYGLKYARSASRAVMQASDFRLVFARYQ